MKIKEGDLLISPGFDDVCLVKKLFIIENKDFDEKILSSQERILVHWAHHGSEEYSLFDFLHLAKTYNWTHVKR